MSDLKALCLDIENFPCEVYSWGLGEQHIPLDFLKKDWSVCAWSAHWVGTPVSSIMYDDTRKQKDIFDDRRVIQGLIKLINEADVIIGQNVEHFDLRKIAARASFHNLPPFRPAKITDILKEERRVFAFTSHKLAYKTEMNTKYQKLDHKAFPGFDLWKACMANDPKGWKEMEKYCKHDVLATEERYLTVKGWIRTHAMAPADGITRCKCGSTDLEARGYANTDAGKFQIYNCRMCGKWPRSPINLMSKAQRMGRLREAS